jgi:hypothetical protein
VKSTYLEICGERKRTEFIDTGMEQRRVLDSTVIKLQFPQQAGIFLRNVCYLVKKAIAQDVSQSAGERFSLTA